MKKIIIILSGFLFFSLTSYAEIGESIEDFKNSGFAKRYSFSLHNQFKADMLGGLEMYKGEEFKGKVVFNFESPTAPSGVSIIASSDGRDILEESILIPHYLFFDVLNKKSDIDKKIAGLPIVSFVFLFLEEATGGRIGAKEMEMLNEMLEVANRRGIGHPVMKRIGEYILGVNLSLIGWEFIVRKAESNKNRAGYKPEIPKPIFNEIAKVYLKNGNVLEGKIAKKTKEGIYLEILDGKGKIFVRHSEIEKVERSRVISNRNKKACYNLGYRWGRCATLAFFGYECPSEDNFVMPKECVGKEATKKGIEAGVKSVWKKLGLLDYKDYKDKNSSRDHYDKALDYFSKANFYYEEGILSKAYEYYEEAERQAQYSRESEDLNSYEDKMMLDIIKECREGTSKIADKRRKFQDLIRNHKIAKGMTMEEVKKSWGSPVSVSKYSNTVSWTFGDCLYGCTIVYFEDGHVVDWSKWYRNDLQK